MKKRTKKQLLSISLAICILLLSFVPVFAVGSFGVDLDSEGYGPDVNPFAAVGYRGECTWYAWGRAYEKTGQRVPCLGNAKKWLDQSGSFGWDTTPSADSIAVWTDGEYGHVAYVEKVEGNLLYITHGNIRSHEYTEGTFNLSTSYYIDWTGLGEWYLTYKPAGYIHLVEIPEGIPVVTHTGDKLRYGRDYTADGNVVTVNYGSPCKIGYLSEGRYVEILPSANPDGSYSFEAPEGVEEVHLVLKGDADLSGEFDFFDVVTAKAMDLYPNNDVSDLQLFAGDIDGDDEFGFFDVILIKAADLGKTPFTYGY
ncbi:MAG: CHAP domain-containing protein [Firmicutes bacterium]|nr:CHAP domain-containing protein [Bacillota bacterium]